jgi:hypothetical protein
VAEYLKLSNTPYRSPQLSQGPTYIYILHGVSDHKSDSVVKGYIDRGAEQMRDMVTRAVTVNWAGALFKISENAARKHAIF